MVKNIIYCIKKGIFKVKVIEKIVYKITHNWNLVELFMWNYLYRKYKKKYLSLISEKESNPIWQKNTNKTIWICWFQGLLNAPDIVKACVESIEKNFTDYKICIIDSSNMYEYVQFPSYIMKKIENGNIILAHLSDLLRLELLINYGGIWIDSTVLCTSPNMPRYLLEEPLFVFKKMDLIRKDVESVVASNWFISACAHNCILEKTRDLLLQYHKDCKKNVENYYVFHIFFTLATECYKEWWEQVPMYQNHGVHTLLFELLSSFNEQRWREIKRFSDIHKLNRVDRNNQEVEYSFYDSIISGKL